MDSLISSARFLILKQSGSRYDSTCTRALPDLPLPAAAESAAEAEARELISIVPPVSPHWPVRRRSVPARCSPLSARAPLRSFSVPIAVAADADGAPN